MNQPPLDMATLREVMPVLFKESLLLEKDIGLQGALAALMMAAAALAHRHGMARDDLCGPFATALAFYDAGPDRNPP